MFSETSLVKMNEDSLKDVADISIMEQPEQDHQECDDCDSEKEWSRDDLDKLLDRMNSYTPDKDKVLYSTRAEKLPWDDIAFKCYTGDECKKVWLSIQRQLRHFRILNELISDGKEMLTRSNGCLYVNSRIRYHPEKPRRPLTMYMLFFKKHKDDILKDNPGINMSQVCKKIAEMYRSLTPEEKDVYAKEAATAKKEYETKLNEFHIAHPGFRGTIESKKLKTPFDLYYAEQSKNNKKSLNKKLLREQCKNEWKNLPDDKKIVWINFAEDEQCKYEQQLKDCGTDNSSNPSKSILTREEQSIKERIAGKPIKPPNSAYHLFLRTMLQSDEIKNISPKERMIHIATLWKDVPEDEKDEFREKSKQLMTQYKVDFTAYLNKLPLDKQQEELQVTSRKRKSTSTSSDLNELNESNEHIQSIKQELLASEVVNISKKPKTNEEANYEDHEIMSVKKKLELQQPKKPPLSAFGYFRLKYNGDLPCKAAWSKLTPQEKQKYEEELDEIKKVYISDFEKFLKSLSKEELEIFSIQNS